jgi:hypothetical protein
MPIRLVSSTGREFAHFMLKQMIAQVGVLTAMSAYALEHDDVELARYVNDAMKHTQKVAELNRLWLDGKVDDVLDAIALDFPQLSGRKTDE